MTLVLDPSVAGAAAPVPARTGRALALGMAVMVFVGTLIVIDVCLFWIGWPDRDDLEIDPVSDHALLVDHLVIVVAAALVLAVSGFVAVRLWRSLPPHTSRRATALLLGAVLAVPAAVGLGGTAAVAIHTVQHAQASQLAAHDSSLPDLALGGITPSCGYTWTCADTVARVQGVRLLAPPLRDGWGINAVDARHPGRLLIGLVRGPAFCFVLSSQVPLGPPQPTTAMKVTKVSLRHTTAVLGVTPVSWQATWAEAGDYFEAQCMSSTDAKTFVDTLAVP
jgi:hypothetical protein